jgi:hypothetical protein
LPLLFLLVIPKGDLLSPLSLAAIVPIPQPTSAISHHNPEASTVIPNAVMNPKETTLQQPPKTVISTEATHSFIVRRAVEKSASLPRPPQAPTAPPLSLRPQGNATNLSLSSDSSLIPRFSPKKRMSSPKPT